MDHDDHGASAAEGPAGEPAPSSAATAPPPLLVFVNGKSGGRRGERLKTALACAPDLDALDVVDLGAARGPEAALRAHGHVEGLRILVCGGDGTVAWVLQALEDLEEVRETPDARIPRVNPPPPAPRNARSREVPFSPPRLEIFPRTFGGSARDPFCQQFPKTLKNSPRSSAHDNPPLLLKQPPPPPLLPPQLHPKPPVGILPLGTGNDLARVFGWGARYDDALVASVGAALANAETRQLDRWVVRVTPGTRRRGDDARDASTPNSNGLRTDFDATDDAETTRAVVDRPPTTRVAAVAEEDPEEHPDAAATRASSSSSPDESASAASESSPSSSPSTSSTSVVFHNYLGVGVDASAALTFHRVRDHAPWMFVSAATNKILYGVFGAVDFVSHSCRGLLANHVRVVADGRVVKLPKYAEGVILLNINSYAGGVRMWDSEEKTPRGAFRNAWGAVTSGGWGDTEFAFDEEEEEDSEAFRSSSSEGEATVLGGVRGEVRSKSVRSGRRRRTTRRARGRSITLGPSRQSDGLLDVVVVYGALHLGQLSWGTDRPVRVCQASSVTLTVDETFPVHVDGQPWEQSACVMEVGLKNRVALLASGDAEARMRASGGGASGTKSVAEGLDEWWTEKKKEGELTFGWEHWEDLDFYDDLEGGARAFVCSGGVI